MGEQPRGRRAEVLEAAIEVAGTSGLGGLTYRSVDVAAGVPIGTTSNHFRTRDALLFGVVTELEKQRQWFWRHLLTGKDLRTHTDLVDLVEAYVRGAVTQMSVRVRAYLVLLLEGWSHPGLREPLKQGRDAQFQRTLHLLRSLDPSTPELHASVLQDYLTGVICQQLANPKPDFDPRPALEVVVSLLFTIGESPAVG